MQLTQTRERVLNAVWLGAGRTPIHLPLLDDEQVTFSVEILSRKRAVNDGGVREIVEMNEGEPHNLDVEAWILSLLGRVQDRERHALEQARAEVRFNRG